jgi:two-component system response regulator AtoC
MTILIRESDREVRNYLELSLTCRGYGVRHAETGDEAVDCLQEADGPEISLVLLDVPISCREDIETLQEIRRINANIPVIMLSGDSRPSAVVEAMKNGATDFLAKPLGNDQLVDAIQRALDSPVVRSKHKKFATQAATQKYLVQESTWMEKHAAMLRQVAASDVPVLLNGETGVGKEVLARALHAGSPRANRRFLKVNCAALPSELIESELFGYERGAFTGAMKSKLGKFDMADGGTILLDEIGDMDFRLQAKLLQVLQDQEFERVGGTETIHVNVRIMAATHADLDKAMKEGRFREDLYYRLNVVNFVVPPLRERPEEIIPLAMFFMEKFAGASGDVPPMTPELKNAMLAYSWPGNVREIENFIRKYLVIQDPETAVEDLRGKMGSRVGSKVTSIAAPLETRPTAVTPPPSLERVTAAQKKAEKDAILSALNRTRWNRKQAARVLGVDYKALLYKMKKHEISRDFVEEAAPFIANDVRMPVASAATN